MALNTNHYVLKSPVLPFLGCGVFLFFFVGFFLYFIKQGSSPVQWEMALKYIGTELQELT